LEDDGADNLRVQPNVTDVSTASIAVNANGVRAAVPTSSNKNATASVTTSDGDQAMASTVATTPAGDGYVKVEVNGVHAEVGDGVTTGVDCYFSGDGGSTARNIADIVATDTLHWVGTIAGYQLAVTDVIDLFYNVV
jgi:hypothetical protein